MNVSPVLRRVFSVLMVFTLALSWLAPLGGTALAESPDIVISQIYGGGGNSGATLTHDYIELFNRGASAVDITGWSVQYASSAGSTWSRTILAGVIQPGQYFLIQEAQGAGGSVALPTPDAVGTITMSSSSGKLALVTNSTLLACGGSTNNCFPNANIRDFVGFGTNANNYEGSGPTANLSNTTAALRAGNGCTDTDNNSADFSVGAPAPRNSASPLGSCGGPTNPSGVGAADPSSLMAGGVTLLSVAVTPGGSPTSSGLAVMADLSAIGGAADQLFYDDGSNGDLTAGDLTFSFLATVDSATTPGGKSLTATISDAEGRSATTEIDLTVEAPLTPIYAIQGSTGTSPFEGQTARTSGVVTVILGNGLFMQDATGDGDPLTSDGIFVFTNTSRNYSPGDLIEVNGTVTEYRSSSRPLDLTLTEFTNVSIVLVSSGNPVPAPILISDRPDSVIAPDGIDSFEALEGMYVEIEMPRVSGPTNTFGESIVIAAGDAANALPSGHILTTYLGPDLVDYNPERILIDDEARLGGGSSTRINNPMVNLTVGQQAITNITGAMDYQFSNYRVQADVVVGDAFAPSTITSPLNSLRDPLPYEARIATFNMENLFDCVNDPDKDDTASCNTAALAALDAKLAKLAMVFEIELKSPELLMVEEIENALVLTGDENGYVPGTSVLALLPRLSGNYHAVSAEASDVRSIEVGFIYNTDRVVLHDYFLSTDLLPDSAGIFDGSVFRAGREPLVGIFSIDGLDVIVIGNHLKSKGGSQYAGDPALEPGDDPLYGTSQPPVRWTEILRHQQGDYLRQLVDLLLGMYPGMPLALGGDLNDFAFPEPFEGLDTVGRIMTSATDPLTDLINLVPEASRFTYVFEGNAQVLDHLLVNDAMLARLNEQAVAHINASFPNSFGTDASVTFRTSDHDPVVGYFCTDTTAPWASASADPSVIWPPSGKLITVNASVTASDNADPQVSIALVSVVSNDPDSGIKPGDRPGDIVIVDDFTFLLRAEWFGHPRIYTITYQVTDACGNATLVSTTVMVNKLIGQLH